MEEEKIIISEIPDIIKDGIHYCPFCGQEKKKHVEYHHYDSETSYPCTCPGYEKMQEILRQASELERQMPRPKYGIKITRTIEKL